MFLKYSVMVDLETSLENQINLETRLSSRKLRLTLKNWKHRSSLGNFIINLKLGNITLHLEI